MAPRLLRPLREKGFVLLWLGQTVSRLGDGAFQVVLTWTVYAITGSTADTGYVLTAFAIPQVLLLLFGGVIGDRFSRRAVILTSDILSGVAAGIIAALGVTGHLTVLSLVILSALFGAVSAFFLPAYQALVPEVVSKDNLQTANSLQGLSFSGSQILGPSIGAAMYAWGRAGAAFAFDAGTFLVAAVASFLISIPPRPQTVAASIVHDLKEGFNYVRQTTWLWLTISMATFANMLTTSSVVLLPAVIRHLNLGVGYMGLTFTISGIASVLANLVLGQLPRFPHRGMVMYGFWTLFGLSNLLLGIAQSYFVVALAAVLLGLAFAGEPIWQSLVQELIPANYLSRVYSLDMLGSFALLPVGFAVSGIVAAAIGVRPTLIAAGAICAAVTFLGLLMPVIRKLD